MLSILFCNCMFSSKITKNLVFVIANLLFKVLLTSLQNVCEYFGNKDNMFS